MTARLPFHPGWLFLVVPASLYGLWIATMVVQEIIRVVVPEVVRAVLR
jgi:hypothetical protein